MGFVIGMFIQVVVNGFLNFVIRGLKFYVVVFEDCNVIKNYIILIEDEKVIG